jgi:hypothetical protein
MRGYVTRVGSCTASFACPCACWLLLRTFRPQVASELVLAAGRQGVDLAAIADTTVASLMTAVAEAVDPRAGARCGRCALTWTTASAALRRVRTRGLGAVKAWVQNGAKADADETVTVSNPLPATSAKRVIAKGITMRNVLAAP